MSDTIRMLVVDDEPLARRRLGRLLALEPGVEVAADCGSGAEATAAILAGGIDAVFLDVQMPGLDGFDVLTAVGPAAMPPVVFVTAFDQYAVKAFDVNAVDYLLKPFDRERFRRAMERLRENVASRSRAAVEEPLRKLVSELAKRKPFLDRFLVASSGAVVFLPAAIVDWIEAQGNYVALHAGAETHLVRQGIGALQERLDPDVFVRVRRTAIVNLERTAALRPWTKDEHAVELKNGTRIAVSRGFREGIERSLARWKP